MLRQTGGTHITCPLCMEISSVSKCPDTLTTNVYALHMAFLKDNTNNGQYETTFFVLRSDNKCNLMCFFITN